MKKMKKLTSLLLVLVMSLALAVPCFAAAAGKVQFNLAGVYLHDNVKVNPGEDYTVDGKKIPAVITYEDTAGSTNNYLPVQMISDLVDIPISWSEKRNSIVLGSTMENAVISTGNSLEGTLHQNFGNGGGTLHGNFSQQGEHQGKAGRYRRRQDQSPNGDGLWYWRDLPSNGWKIYCPHRYQQRKRRGCLYSWPYSGYGTISGLPGCEH